MRAIIIAAIIVLAVPAQAQQSTFTDRNGNYAGSATTRGNASTFTNSSGQFSGSAITHGNRTDYFDARGRYQGSTTRPTATR